MRLVDSGDTGFAVNQHMQTALLRMANDNMDSVERYK